MRSDTLWGNVILSAIAARATLAEFSNALTPELARPRAVTAAAIKGGRVGISPMNCQPGRRSVAATRREGRAWLTG
jgi:hypothetical protein